jgi:hypothetical protein
MGYLLQGRHRRHFARPWKQALAYLETKQINESLNQNHFDRFLQGDITKFRYLAA